MKLLRPRLPAAPSPPIFLKLFLHTNPPPHPPPFQSVVKQVTKSNFSEELPNCKNHLAAADLVAISLQTTGSHSSTWHRIQSFDSAHIAYCKAKHAAERFQVLNFAVCPFSIDENNKAVATAYPYNFHLFPRDEFRIGMPSYSFSCQSSVLTSLAQQDFDFNGCIYDGLSYLSRHQESVSQTHLVKQSVLNHEADLLSDLSVADTIFLGRIASRLKHWRNACADSTKGSDDALIGSLRKLVLGGEEYASRPCISIDVQSERQVLLILKAVTSQFDDLVPLQVPAKGGGTQSVRIILTSSKDDKAMFEKEQCELEAEQTRKFRGFREVIDLISASKKPLITSNFLNDLTIVYSKFIAPLPLRMSDFASFLQPLFPCICDVSCLQKDNSPVQSTSALPAAMSSVEKQLFAPNDMATQLEEYENGGKIHENSAVKISHVFAEFCSMLKFSTKSLQSDNTNLFLNVGDYGCNFVPCLTDQDKDILENKRVWTNNNRKVSPDNLVFIWGFREGTSARELKETLQASHAMFSHGFDVQLVDESCAIIVFRQPGVSYQFLQTINSEDVVNEPLRDLASEGLCATGYQTYNKVCESQIWEATLADSLDKALSDPSRKEAFADQKYSKI